MIAFATAISDPEAYRRRARPGIELAAEPGSEILAFAAVGADSRSHNLLLDRAANLEDLEALVVVHQDAEIVDAATCAKVRGALRDPEVAIAGAVGATNVHSIAWWEGSVITGPVRQRYEEHGGGDLLAYGWAGAQRGTGEVDAAYGFLLVLSPWAVRTLRFNEALHLGHGYDVDLCRQARAAGRKVVVADVAVIDHRPLELIDDLDVWVEAHVQFADIWDEQEGGDDDAWRPRARRAEAEREAARTVAYSKALELDARVMGLERALECATESLSWRVTTPLRRLNQLRGRLADRRAGRGASGAGASP